MVVDFSDIVAVFLGVVVSIFVVVIRGGGKTDVLRASVLS